MLKIQQSCDSRKAGDCEGTRTLTLRSSADHEQIPVELQMGGWVEIDEHWMCKACKLHAFARSR